MLVASTNVVVACAETTTGWLLLPSSTVARSCACCAGCGAVDRRPLCRYAATPFCHYADLPLRRKVRSVWPTHVCAHHPAQTGCAVHRPSDGLCCAQAVWPPHEHRERRRMCACARRRLALAPRRAAARVSACRADVDGAVCRQVHLGAAAAYGVTASARQAEARAAAARAVVARAVAVAAVAVAAVAARRGGGRRTRRCSGDCERIVTDHVSLCNRL